MGGGQEGIHAKAREQYDHEAHQFYARKIDNPCEKKRSIY
jgi:hypothetical protein